jgi:hypothetical protein
VVVVWGCSFSGSMSAVLSGPAHALIPLPHASPIRSRTLDVRGQTTHAAMDAVRGWTPPLVARYRGSYTLPSSQTQPTEWQSGMVYDSSFKKCMCVCFCVCCVLRARARACEMCVCVCARSCVYACVTCVCRNMSPEWSRCSPQTPALCEDDDDDDEWWMMLMKMVMVMVMMMMIDDNDDDDDDADDSDDDYAYK